MQFLQHCKRGVRIVNVARGGLLDYDAVKAGLESGIIAGMGLDVQWQVLLLMLCLRGLAFIYGRDRPSCCVYRNHSIHKTSSRSIRKWC